jgi:hypothetical protein
MDNDPENPNFTQNLWTKGRGDHPTIFILLLLFFLSMALWERNFVSFVTVTKARFVTVTTVEWAVFMSS